MLEAEIYTSAQTCTVVRVLEQVTNDRGKPRTIRVHNGPEFISTSLDHEPVEGHAQLPALRG
jgi:hypothetical protein